MTPEAAARPRRWWIALALNALLPPSGYAYAGAWLGVAVTVLMVTTIPILATVATLQAPPGIYLAQGAPAALAGVAILGFLGLHAALLTRGAPPIQAPTGRHLLLCLAPFAGAMLINVTFSAWWPNPAYTFASASMQPTLQRGDVVAMSGPRAVCRADPRPGDVVLLRRDGVLGLQRVVAGPGQRVMLSDGELIIDGAAVPRRKVGTTRVMETAMPVDILEEVLPNGARYRTQDFGPDGALDDVAEITVPAASWYVLGDNRDNAADSRTAGPVAARDICAVGLKVLSSKDASRVGQRP